MGLSGVEGSTMEVRDNETVDQIRDDLDNYGSHLPVVIETSDGRWFHVGEITTGQYDDGAVAVVINMGERIADR